MHDSHDDARADPSGPCSDTQIDVVARAMTRSATSADLRARVLHRLPERAPRAVDWQALRAIHVARPALALVACAIVAAISWHATRPTSPATSARVVPSIAAPAVQADAVVAAPAQVASRSLTRPGRERLAELPAPEHPLPPISLTPLSRSSIQPEPLETPLLHVGAIATPAITLAPIDLAADRPNRF